MDRATELEALGDVVRRELDAANAAREVALAACRRTIRACGSSIRAVHLRRPEDARRLADEAEEALREAQKALAPHPSLAGSGPLNDAAKEYAESRLTAAMVGDLPLPSPDELAVPASAWLNGLAEAASELRRHLLDRLREGDLSRSETLLATMDEAYGLLVTMDYQTRSVAACAGPPTPCAPCWSAPGATSPPPSSKPACKPHSTGPPRSSTNLGTPRGCSSAGRAPRSQRGSRRFESAHLHRKSPGQSVARQPGGGDFLERPLGLGRIEPTTSAHVGFGLGEEGPRLRTPVERASPLSSVRIAVASLPTSGARCLADGAHRVPPLLAPVAGAGRRRRSAITAPTAPQCQ